MEESTLNCDIEYLEKILKNIDNLTNKTKIKTYVNYKINNIKNTINYNENLKKKRIDKKISHDFKLQIQIYQKLLVDEENKIKIDTTEFDEKIKMLEQEIKFLSTPQLLIPEPIKKVTKPETKIDLYKLKKEKIYINTKIHESKNIISCLQTKIEEITKKFNQENNQKKNMINTHYSNINNNVLNKIDIYEKIKIIEIQKQKSETEYKLKKQELFSQITVEKDNLNNHYHKIKSLKEVDKKEKPIENKNHNYEEINKKRETIRIDNYNKLNQELEVIKLKKKKYIEDKMKIKKKTKNIISLYKNHIYNLKQNYSKITDRFESKYDTSIYLKRIENIESLFKQLNL